ncbi:MAG: hypothetical protein JWP81_3958 [Ferruginibacter sp.]|nr:hypothetical protein [Ferruginibacter sp.]
MVSNWLVSSQVGLIWIVDLKTGLANSRNEWFISVVSISLPLYWHHKGKPIAARKA